MSWKMEGNKYFVGQMQTDSNCKKFFNAFCSEKDVLAVIPREIFLSANLSTYCSIEKKFTECLLKSLKTQRIHCHWSAKGARMSELRLLLTEIKVNANSNGLLHLHLSSFLPISLSLWEFHLKAGHTIKDKRNALKTGREKKENQIGE